MATWKRTSLGLGEHFDGPLEEAQQRRPQRGLRWLELLLTIVGVLCLGYFLYAHAEARRPRRADRGRRQDRRSDASRFRGSECQP